MNDLFDVQGKVALVTGGSRGIGRMIARGLVARGATVYITARTGCEETARELSKEGRCLPLQADLSQEGGVRSLAAALRAAEPALQTTFPEISCSDETYSMKRRAGPNAPGGTNHGE